MAVDLFAGIPVSDFAASLAWYEQLLGSPPAFLPNDIEAVWELAEHRFLYIEHLPEHAGHAQVTIFVEEFDTRPAEISERGLQPARSKRFTRTASARRSTAMRKGTRSA